MQLMPLATSRASQKYSSVGQSGDGGQPCSVPIGRLPHGHGAWEVRFSRQYRRGSLYVCPQSDRAVTRRGSWHGDVIGVCRSVAAEVMVTERGFRSDNRLLCQISIRSRFRFRIWSCLYIGVGLVCGSDLSLEGD